MIPRYGEWEQRFASRGLSVIGVHTAEYDEERSSERVARFVREHAIRWPVVLDPDYVVWDRFQVAAWPTVLLIDRRGVVRAIHIGDDRASAIERDILRLLDS
jgi:hypothetical protein